jgi:Arc/MetJ family transcription regulator
MVYSKNLEDMAGRPYPWFVKMTMHIDETVLADVMELTGAASKTEAVELALREMARRHRQRRLLKEGLQLTPEQWDAEARPSPSDEIDAPDIDQEAVKRYLAATDPKRRRPEPFGLVAEPEARSETSKLPPPPSTDQEAKR